MSKIVRLVISLAAVGGMMVAAMGSIPASAQTAHAKCKGTIAFLRPGPDEYYVYASNGAKQAATRLGYCFKDYGNPNISPTVEQQNMDAAIAAHSKAITGFAVNFSGETADISKANKAHIPIFILYGYSKPDLKNVVGFLQVPLQPYGKPVGKWMYNHLKSGQVAVITGQLGRGDAEGYQQGFLKGLKCQDTSLNPKTPQKCGKGGKLTLVTTQSAHWLKADAYPLAKNLITQYPNLKGVYAENDAMATGAILGFKQAGKMKQITLTSCNGAPYGLKAMKAGDLKASDTDSPAQEGLLAVRFLDRALKTHKYGGGHLYYTPYTFVTKATMKNAVGWVPSKAKYNKLMSAPLPKPVPANKLP